MAHKLMMMMMAMKMKMLLLLLLLVTGHSVVNQRCPAALPAIENPDSKKRGYAAAYHTMDDDDAPPPANRVCQTLST